jgi:hypothetical protein
MQNAERRTQKAPNPSCDFVSDSATLAGRRTVFPRENGPFPCGTSIAIQVPMDKPYDIKQRTFLFASEALLAYPADHLNARTERAWLQFVAAATSGGAHLEEAEAAASRAHFVTLTRGALRE